MGDAMQTDLANPMISSADVNGTAVYNTEGDKLGTIDHLMLDKKSGKVAYAVMGSGGFLGIGEEYSPIPWNALKYDTTLEGYVTGITAEQYRTAPKWERDWDRDRDWETRVWSHYGLQPYWV